MLKSILYVVTVTFPLFSTLKKRYVYAIGGKRIKPRKVYWLLVAAVLSIISISTETYTDIDTYTNVFDWTNESGIYFDTIGWSFLCKVFYYLGFNYRGMIPFVIFFSVWLISRACKKIGIQEEQVLSLMLIFPGLMNVIQLKFFLAMSIVMYSITYLQKPDEKRYILKYILGVILAALIHSASIFCIVFLLAVTIERLDTSKSILYAMFALIGAVAVLKFVPTIASKFLREEVVRRYFTGAIETSSINWIIEISIAWLLMVTVAWLNLKSSGIVVGATKKDAGDREVFLSRSFTMVCLIGISLPLLLFDQNFHRFIEIEYLIGYMICIYCKNNIKSKKDRNGRILTILLFLIIGYSVRYFVTFDRVLPLLSWDGIVKLRR